MQLSFPFSLAHLDTFTLGLEPGVYLISGALIGQGYPDPMQGTGALNIVIGNSLLTLGIALAGDGDCVNGFAGGVPVGVMQPAAVVIIPNTSQLIVPTLTTYTSNFGATLMLAADKIG